MTDREQEVLQQPVLKRQVAGVAAAAADAAPAPAPAPAGVAARAPAPAPAGVAAAAQGDGGPPVGTEAIEAGHCCSKIVWVAGMCAHGLVHGIEEVKKTKNKFTPQKLVSA